MTRPTYSPLRLLTAIALTALTVWALAIRGNTVPHGPDRARWETPTSFRLAPPLRVDNPAVP